MVLTKVVFLCGINLSVMSECFGNEFILNGILQPSDLFDNSLIYEGESVYEVIRMKNSNPIFFDDHMERLQKSVSLQKKEPLASIHTLKKDIINLTKTEKKKEANLKIVFNYNNEKANYLLYIIESIYPTEEQYRTGVKGTLFPAERKTPESKVINHKLRSSIYHKLIMEGAYEALLVNEGNCITEGSRSNIFFIRDGTLFTAPDNVVLSGITRKYIIDLCNEHSIKVRQECINVEDLPGFDAVFMTGTSPMVIPFCLIDNHHFKVTNPIIKKLRDLYIKKAGESIRLFRSDVTV